MRVLAQLKDFYLLIGLTLSMKLTKNEKSEQIKATRLRRSLARRKADDEPKRRGRVPQSDRIGLLAGRPTRTAHISFRGVQVGTQGGRGGSIDYIARQGDYADHDDLVHLEGDVDELRQALVAVDHAAIWRSGRTAERVGISTVLELPLDADLDAQRRVAAALVAYWYDQGHNAIAAVHDEPGNPHIHVLATARPVQRVVDKYVVDRSAPPPLRGKAAVQAARRDMAAIVNDHAAPTVRFFGGRDRDLDLPGIVGRPPKKRIPERLWHRESQRERDEAEVARVREAAQARRWEAAEAKAERAADASARAQRRAKHAAAAAGMTVITPASLRRLSARQVEYLHDRLLAHGLDPILAYLVIQAADDDVAARTLAFRIAKGDPTATTSATKPVRRPVDAVQPAPAPTQPESTKTHPAPTEPAKTAHPTPAPGWLKRIVDNANRTVEQNQSSPPTISNKKPSSRDDFER